MGINAVSTFSLSRKRVLFLEKKQIKAVRCEFFFFSLYTISGDIFGKRGNSVTPGIRYICSLIDTVCCREAYSWVKLRGKNIFFFSPSKA